MTRILTFTKIGLQDMSNIRQRDNNLRLQSIYVHQDFTEYISIDVLQRLDTKV